MGYETHVFAWADGSIGEKTADYFYPISIIEKEEILNKCKEIKPDAVCTIASDLANITVQYIAKRLNLPTNSDECIEKSTNKYSMRCAFRDGGVSCPFFAKVSSIDELKKYYPLSFPLIVKPTDRSGSRGITKVYTEDELSLAIKVSSGYAFEKKAIVEEFIDGPEFSCECISYNGEHKMLAITKKYTTGAPHFIETGHLEPAPLTGNVGASDVQSEIFKGLDALGIKNGASHSEFKITADGKIKIIEIGSRMGGDCIGSDLVKLSSGYDFVKAVIEVSLGQRPTLMKEAHFGAAAIRFVFGKKDISILEKIKVQAPEALYFISEIEDSDEKIVDSGTRHGFYIATANSPSELAKLMELSE